MRCTVSMINEETLNQWATEYKLLSNKPLWEFLKDKGLHPRYDAVSIYRMDLKINPWEARKRIFKG